MIDGLCSLIRLVKRSVFRSDFAIILFFVAASTVMSGYYYGAADHAVTIPFMKSFYDSGLYPNDVMLPLKWNYYTFLWIILGFFTEVAGIPAPGLFFAVYLACKFFSFYAVYLIAGLLFREKKVSYLALFFLMVSKPHLCWGDMLDPTLNNRVVALPFLLFAIYFYLKYRKTLAYVLMGVGSSIHGINTLTVFTGLSLAYFFTSKNRMKLAVFILLFAVFASPLIAWRIALAQESQSMFYASPHWLKLERFRNSGSFPSTWSLGVYSTASVFLVIFALSALEHKPSAEHHITVKWFVFAVLIMMAAGFVFNEIIPVAISFNLTTLRSFKFLQYFAVIYFSNHLIRELEGERRIFVKVVSVFLGVWLFFGPNIRYPEYYASLTAILLLAGALVYKIASGKIIKLGGKHVLCAAAVVFLGFLAVNGLDRVVVGNIQEKHWLDVQYWAENYTTRGDMFLTTPLKEGFRVESERPIYGDFMDGNLLQLNTAYGFEWEKRMMQVNCMPAQWWTCDDNYKRLTETQIKALSRKYGITYIVTERKDLKLAPVYENSKYVVYELGNKP